MLNVNMKCYFLTAGFLQPFAVPQGAKHFLFVALHQYLASKPLGHRQFVAKLIIVHHPALFYFHHCLPQEATVGQAHHMGTTSTQVCHIAHPFINV